MNLPTKEDIRLDEWEYEFTQRNKHTALMADLWGRSYQNFSEELGIPIPATDYIFTASSKGFVKTEWKKTVLDTLRTNLDEKLLGRMIDNMFLRLREFEEFSHGVINSLKEPLTRGDLHKLWKEFDKLYLNVIPWYCLPYYITTENMLTDKVKERLQKHKDEIEKHTDLNHALMILIFPTKEALFQQEQRAFHNLLKKALTIPEFSHDNEFGVQAESYLEKYAWMKTFLVLPIEPLSYEELVIRVKEGLKNKEIEDYELKQGQHGKNRELAGKLLEIVEDDKELVKWINWSREFGWFLTAGVEQSLRDLARLIPFYKTIAKTIDVPYDDWNNFTSEEIRMALENPETLPKNQLEDRKKGYFYNMKDKQGQFAYGNNGLELSAYIENTSKADENVTEIKGQSASPGHAKGKACICLFAANAHKVQEGEILVCSMTSPDYVPAMKKASAIVTDEGGLLSHAAIVSRELGKPCIVGTKIATKVLKDGTIIEVDANTGVVKIIR